MRRLRQRLDAVFEDAIFHKWASFNPAAAIRRKIDEQGPKRGRGAFAALPYREVAPFMARLRQMPGTGARCLEFAILTAARTSEALYAEWSEFDLEGRVWIVPGERMKAGEPHTVYLSDEAMAVLLAQRARTERLVFPSPWSTEVERPLSNMATLEVWWRACEGFELEQVRKALTAHANDTDRTDESAADDYQPGDCRPDRQLAPQCDGRHPQAVG